MTLDSNDLTIVGLVVTNATILVSAYVNLRVNIAKLETLVKELSKDVNTLGNLYRSVTKRLTVTDMTDVTDDE